MRSRLSQQVLSDQTKSAGGTCHLYVCLSGPCLPSAPLGPSATSDDDHGGFSGRQRARRFGEIKELDLDQ